MTEQEMRDKLPNLIADHVGVKPEQCGPDARFIEDLGCDSLDVVEITMAFEEEFDLEINDSEMESVATVGQAADLLAAKLAAR